jgi:hypothetical protein
VRIPGANPRRTRHTEEVVNRNLDTLLAHLSVHKRPGTWCIVSGVDVPHDVAIQASIVEAEGTTTVIATGDAKRLGIHPDFVAAWLTLEVHSALDAVGLTAVVATALAAEGIPCNVLTGYHHDHLLVPAEQSDVAIAVLMAFSEADRL